MHEGTTQPTLAKASPSSVATSFLEVGDEIVGCENTSCACIRVVEPLVGDVVRVAQVLYPRHFWPGTLGKEACSSGASVGSCQKTVRAALGVAVH